MENELKRQIESLSRELAAEREARLKAEDDVTTFKEFWEKTDAARLKAEEALAAMKGIETDRDRLLSRCESLDAAVLRAEAGAAQLRVLYEAIKARKDLRAVFHETIDAAFNAVTTDTGARLAAVVEEARKKGCMWQEPRGYSCVNQHGQFLKEFWCTNCKLVDAAR